MSAHNSGTDLTVKDVFVIGYAFWLAWWTAKVMFWVTVGVLWFTWMVLLYVFNNDKFKAELARMTPKPPAPPKAEPGAIPPVLKPKITAEQKTLTLAQKRYLHRAAV